MLSPTQQNALHWIVRILEENHIPYQITGGFAAKLYGSDRELDDIDMDIPEDAFETLKEAVKPYIIYGPERFNDKLWDLTLMTLDYQGQKIDFSGAYTTQIFNKKTQQWQALTANFSTAKTMELFDLKIPVISLNELIAYKNILERNVDVEDVRQIALK